MANAARVFDDSPAVRGPTPLLFGLAGPSGSGKTYSALRLATGMQRVIGGDVFFIDTESNRALHYAENFKFRHVPFAAPFSPDDYLLAIEQQVKKGARIIVVDSFSHEHDGPGGVLEWHSAEVERLMNAWSCREDKANIPAWGKPKSARRKLLTAITQMQCNFVLCFRARDKIKIATGKGKTEVVQLGFMPIAGEEFVYELTAKSLLLPGAGGVPTLESEEVGERLMIKLPEQFRGMFTGAKGKPIDEDLGEQLARWAAGTAAGNQQADIVENLRAAYDTCVDQETFATLEAKRLDAWKKIPTADKPIVKAASDVARARVVAAEGDGPSTVGLYR